VRQTLQILNDGFIKCGEWKSCKTSSSSQEFYNAWRT